MNKKPRLLFVDDEKYILDTLEEIFLYTDKYEVFKAESGREALEKLRQYQIDLVITDIKMPEMDGVDLAGMIRQVHPSVEIIFVTAIKERIARALELKPVDVVEKSASKDILLNKVEKYFESVNRVSESANQAKKSKLDALLATIALGVFAFFEGLSSAITIITGQHSLSVLIKGLVAITSIGVLVYIIIRLRKS